MRFGAVDGVGRIATHKIFFFLQLTTSDNKKNTTVLPRRITSMRILHVYGVCKPIDAIIFNVKY